MVKPIPTHLHWVGFESHCLPNDKYGIGNDSTRDAVIFRREALALTRSWESDLNKASNLRILVFVRYSALTYTHRGLIISEEGEVDYDDDVSVSIGEEAKTVQVKEFTGLALPKNRAGKLEYAAESVLKKIQENSFRHFGRKLDNLKFYNENAKFKSVTLNPKSMHFTFGRPLYSLNKENRVQSLSDTELQHMISKLAGVQLRGEKNEYYCKYLGISWPEKFSNSSLVSKNHADFKTW